MELNWSLYAIVCPLVFLAGFIDSIAGGGGLISLPAYYLAGLNPYLAAGTNKLSACIGTIASAGSYARSKKIDWCIGVVAAIGALPGSWAGSSLQMLISENAVRIMMICVIPVIAVIVLRKRSLTGGNPRFTGKAAVIVGFAIGVVVGFYDGLIGPGTGTFLIILMTALLGMEAVKASGTAKIINLASNIAAMVNYLTRGSVLLALGIPAAFCAIAGNLLGARLTIQKGTGVVRRVMIIVLVLLLAKMLYDVIS